MNKLIFPKMAYQNIKRGRQIYMPYILTIIGTTAGYYITTALANDSGISQMRGSEYVAMMMFLGSRIVGLFAAIFLLYTNSFLIKRRKRELGLYSVLGMGKKHIAVLLTIETLFVSLAGIGGGMLFGMLLYKLALLLLFRMLRFPIPFGFSIDVGTICETLGFFALIMLLTLLANLWSVWRMNTIQLLQSSGTGEKEPRARILVTLAGLAALGGGYYITIKVNSAVEAFAFYFLAVFLVIIGTYCLFTSISISIMKLLRKNKAFYYKSRNFITLSGMLYRMKRNAVGLSNICILSTMVLVMISGTVSLYLGTEDALNARYPDDICAYIRYRPDPEAPFQSLNAAEAIKAAVWDEGAEVESLRQRKYLPVSLSEMGDGRFRAGDSYDMTQKNIYMCFLSYDDVAGELPEGTPRPGQNEAYCWADGVAVPTEIEADFLEGGLYKWRALPLGGKKLTVGEVAGYLMDTMYLVLPDDQALERVYLAHTASHQLERVPSLGWECLISLSEGTENQGALSQSLEEKGAEYLTRYESGGWESLRIESRQAQAEDVYVMNGGFLFLGIMLGTIFIMGAVLIIYYKQVSEGHDDRGRYQIMQQVGLSKKEVKSSIRRQILSVFFLPLLVAALHVIFDFRIMLLLLRLFFLYNWQLTALCTAGAFIIFAAIYAAVYALTARTYYKIVS